ncbi:hypothetical protein Leryth_010775 [Lithospermum erythrorhizon]|uniref:DNA repair RAD52-like protein 2, chloroplastic n=1 Tax=Lithospermum erythrorhizon TaxID=34254 RepID=A0AAV3PF93_LITER|nr:hypothetical protein Leryth_010775 [Lithospermum erythrorhizon]
MATQIQCPKSTLPPSQSSLFLKQQPIFRHTTFLNFGNVYSIKNHAKLRLFVVSALDRSSSNSKVPNSNYVVPMDNSSCITRPLGEILRDLNKRIPDNIIKIRDHGYDSTFIPWYHANRMLSFYAPGWCGEIRDVIFSDNGSVTVVYRVTIRGSDGEAYRESTGTVSSSDTHTVDPVAAAEEIAFCRACARFGLGLYLYHEQ